MTYGSLFGNNQAQQSNSKMDFLQNLTKTDQNTSLQSLMEKIDLTRTKGWQKSMVDEYRKIFAGEGSNDALAATKKNALDLSKSAKALSDSGKDLAMAGSPFFGDNVGILNKIKDFVGNYNDTIDGLKNSDSVSALQKGASMVSLTAAYSKSLAGAGITVGADNKLSIDEKKFQSASEGQLKSLFSGNYSYASKVSDKAGAIDRNAQIQANTLYNNAGKQYGMGTVSLKSIFSGAF